MHGFWRYFLEFFGVGTTEEVRPSQRMATVALAADRKHTNSRAPHGFLGNSRLRPGR